jgi:hypothetical protein
MSSAFAPEAAPSIDTPTQIGGAQHVKASDLASSRERKQATTTTVLNLLPKLLDACRWSDGSAAEKLGLEIAAAIEVTHAQIAERIRKRVETSLSPKPGLRCPNDLLESIPARHGLADVILPLGVEDECKAIIREHQRSAELARFKLYPRHKILFYGPPGNGKTLLAEGLAKELDVPFFPVKYSGLVDSYLGATGKNLAKIFDFAANGPCVVFMDEFDGIAIDRGDSKDVGEIRRVTNQILLTMDRMPTTCVFIAATNAEELLDRAVERRFDFVLELPAPTPEMRLECAKRELSPALTPGHDVSHLADRVAQMALANLSALVKLCQRIRRDLVLNEGNGVDAILQVSCRDRPG